MLPWCLTFGKYFENYERGQQLSAIKKWNIDKVRHTTKEKRLHSYKSHNSAKVNVKSLNDDDSYDAKNNISKSGGKEKHLFSSDSD